jgi:hypothetical protein
MSDTEGLESAVIIEFPSRTRVTIEVPDFATGLVLVDAKLKTVAKGYGRIVVDLEPGVYKARSRVGASAVERVFSVDGDASDATVTLSPVSFASPLPLNFTSTSHEHHQAAVADAMNSTSTPRVLGHGGELLLFVRDPMKTSTDAIPGNIGQYRELLTSVSVLQTDGTMLAHVNGFGTVSEDLGYATLCVQLAPGSYVLALGPTGARPRFQSFFVAAGWRTEIFVSVARENGNSDFISLDAADLAIVMSPVGRPFSASDLHYRLYEVARQALVRGRRVLEHDALTTFVAHGEENPMLALLAAHLMLLEPTVDSVLLRKATNDLSRWLGADCADVMALRFKLRMLERKATKPRRVKRAIAAPPMLYSSWSLIMSLDTEFAVPLLGQDDLAYRVASDIAISGPWLTWTITPPWKSSSPQHTQVPPIRAKSRHIHPSKVFRGSGLPDLIASVGGISSLDVALHLAQPVVGLAQDLWSRFAKPIRTERQLTDEFVASVLTVLVERLPWKRIAEDALANPAKYESLIGELSALQRALLPTLATLAEREHGERQIDGPLVHALLDSHRINRELLMRALVGIASIVWRQHIQPESALHDVIASDLSIEQSTVS